MIIAKNDEARRSRVWTITMIVSSLLIVMIAVYFLLKFFTANPLEGSWESEDGNLSMDVDDSGKVTVEVSDISVITSSDEKTEASIEMTYVIDRDAKTIAIKGNRAAIEEAAQKSDGEYTAEVLENTLSGLMTTFDYNVENRELTLTEREYGESLTFIKK